MNNKRRKAIFICIIASVFVILTILVIVFGLKNKQFNDQLKEANCNSGDVDINDFLEEKEENVTLYYNEGTVTNKENNVLTVKVTDKDNNVKEEKIKVDDKTELLQENNDIAITMDDINVDDEVYFYVKEEEKNNPGENGEVLAKSVTLFDMDEQGQE